MLSSRNLKWIAGIAAAAAIYFFVTRFLQKLVDNSAAKTSIHETVEQ